MSSTKCTCDQSISQQSAVKGLFRSNPLCPVCETQRLSGIYTNSKSQNGKSSARDVPVEAFLLGALTTPYRAAGAHLMMATFNHERPRSIESTLMNYYADLEQKKQAQKSEQMRHHHRAHPSIWMKIFSFPSLLLSRGMGMLGSQLGGIFSARATSLRFASVGFMFLFAMLIGSSLYSYMPPVSSWPQGRLLHSYLMDVLGRNPLQIQPVASFIEQDQTGRILNVEATVVNKSSTAHAVPDVVYTLIGKDKREIYSWVASSGSQLVAAGETIRFQRRLFAPPENAEEVRIHFVPHKPEVENKLATAW